MLGIMNRSNDLEKMRLREGQRGPVALIDEEGFLDGVGGGVTNKLFFLLCSWFLEEKVLKYEWISLT